MTSPLPLSQAERGIKIKFISETALSLRERASRARVRVLPEDFYETDDSTYYRYDMRGMQRPY